MNRRILAPVVLLAVAALVGGFFLATGGPEPAPAPAPPTGVPRALVTLGDSTVSGEAAGDYDEGTDGRGGNWCHRSKAASIHQTGLRAVEKTYNLACSGANSAQVGLGDGETHGEKSQARRLGPLARANRVVAVVVAVGANDDPKFSQVLDGCVQAWLNPGRPGCGQEFARTWDERVTAMTPKVAGVLTDIRSVMSDAGYADTDYALVLQSYAAPVSPNVRTELRNLNGCPFRAEDLQWVRDQAVPRITEGLRAAATETGARFLDLSRSGEGHEACALTDPAGEWFSRLSVNWDDLRDADRADHALQESFHPNATAHARVGRCLGEFLGTSAASAACLPDERGDLHPALPVP